MSDTSQDFYRIQKLPPYVFAVINEMRAKARAAGLDVVDLGMGNPDGATPQPVVEKLREAAQNPANHRYSVSRGISPLREAIVATRKGGTLSILGVYGIMDKFPIGVVMNKGLTVRTAQQHGQKYVPRLLEYASRGELNPAVLATHRFSLEEGPRAYEMFKNKEDGIVRAVFAP